MKKALSGDVRRLALEKLDNGATQKDVAAYFKVTERTLYNWNCTRKKEGRTEPISYGERNKGKPSPLRQIQDDDAFKALLRENNFSTKREIADRWNALHDASVTVAGVATCLVRNNITYKKKLQLTKKQIQLKEANIWQA